MPDPFIPTSADLASLQNTMLSGDVLSQMERERVANAQTLAARTQQAQLEAGRAQRQYGAAAAQPAPEVAPNEALLNALGGNIASVLQGTQAPAQRAAERTSETRAGLIRMRLENLQALRDNMVQKASIARQVGDNEMEMSMRQKMETLAKTIDVLQTSEKAAQAKETATQKQLDDIEMEKIKSGLRENEARTKAAALLQAIGYGVDPTKLKDLASGAAGEIAKNADPVANYANALATNQMKWSDIKPTQLTIPVVRYMAQREMTVLEPKVRNTVNDIAAARSALDQFRNVVLKVNTEEPSVDTTFVGGFTNLGARARQGLTSAAKGAMQMTVEDAKYESKKKGLTAPISRSTGERGVLTEGDALRAQGLLPNRSDLKSVALSKLDDFEEWLDQKEAESVIAYTGTLGDIKARAEARARARAIGAGTRVIDVRAPRGGAVAPDTTQVRDANELDFLDNPALEPDSTGADTLVRGWTTDRNGKLVPSR